MLHGFWKSSPGKRFRYLHDRKRDTAGGRLYRCAVTIAGVLLCLIGLVFLAIPGPGIPVLLLGAALIAQQSQSAAELLDRTELRLRRLLRRR